MRVVWTLYLCVCVCLSHFFSVCVCTTQVTSEILTRKGKHCNFVEYRNDVIVSYKRFAGLYFIIGINKGMDNELIALETIQHFVETLDQYFGNVCELDLIFNFSRAYHILDEVILGGYVQEPRRGVVLNSIGKQDALVEATEG